MKKHRVLFLCTGNSCRSQMAEGWLRQLANGKVEVGSAGIEAHGKNPWAVAVMREAGLDISQQESKQLTSDMLQWADLVVTVCGHADESCPALPAATQREHWALDDPAKASGDDTKLMSVFRASRDDIRARVVRLLARLPD